MNSINYIPNQKISAKINEMFDMWSWLYLNNKLMSE